MTLKKPVPMSWVCTMVFLKLLPPQHLSMPSPCLSNCFTLHCPASRFCGTTKGLVLLSRIPQAAGGTTVSYCPADKMAADR